LRRKTNMNKKHLMLTGLITIAFFNSCKTKNKSDEQALKTNGSIPVYQVKRTNLLITEDYVADIQAMQNVEIRSRVKGFLNKIHVDEGEKVKKGQALFSISDEIYQSELMRAKANTQIAIADAKAAELTMKNAKILVEKGVVNRTEFELAKAKHESLTARVDEAKANQMMAEINLSHAVIRAPFDGIIDRIPYKTGSVINEGDLLTSISDVSFVHVYFKISEIEYLTFMKESSFLDSFKVSLLLADGSVFPDKGFIQTIEGDFEMGTGSIAIRAKFPNKDKVLKHGSTGRIRLESNLDNVLIIPQKATFDIQDKTFVYVLEKDQTIKLKVIEIVGRHKSYYIINDDSLFGRMIVYEGIQNLKQGQLIEPTQISDKQVEDALASK